MNHKTRSQNQSLFSGPGIPFWRGLYPPLVAGFLLTSALITAEQYAILPGLWLLLYGTAVATGGAHSVRPVPLMGFSFMLLGCVALAAPQWNDLLMAIGFGGLHIAFGLIIARHHGG